MPLFSASRDIFQTLKISIHVSKERVYKYGEFFPYELTCFKYNESSAQQYFPLDKENALEQGFQWKDKEGRNLNIDVHAKELWKIFKMLVKPYK